jgi:hypothetical protein
VAICLHASGLLVTRIFEVTIRTTVDARRSVFARVRDLLALVAFAVIAS